jgi:tight adherence protein C
MGSVDKSRRQIVQWLTEAVDSLTAAVGSGRLGFDHAVKEYVDSTDNELSRAFQGYVQAVGLGDQTPRARGEEAHRLREEARRTALQGIAAQFPVPEVTAFVAALLESQDKHLSLVDTLRRQAAQLHRSP